VGRVRNGPTFFIREYQHDSLVRPAGFPELLWAVLTAKRWEILKALCGAGPVSIREAARRVGRDVKAVHGDVTALLNAGLLDRAEGGGVEFPYDAVKVEFMLQAA
jgi:predicted transcriptional regulator